MEVADRHKHVNNVVQLQEIHLEIVYLAVVEVGSHAVEPYHAHQDANHHVVPETKGYIS